MSTLPPSVETQVCSRRCAEQAETHKCQAVRRGVLRPLPPAPAVWGAGRSEEGPCSEGAGVWWPWMADAHCTPVPTGLHRTCAGVGVAGFPPFPRSPH